MSSAVIEMYYPKCTHRDRHVYSHRAYNKEKDCKF